MQGGNRPYGEMAGDCWVLTQFLVVSNETQWQSWCAWRVLAQQKVLTLLKGVFPRMSRKLELTLLVKPAN